MRVDPDCLAEPVAAVLAEFPKLELPLVKKDLKPHPRLGWFAVQSAASLFSGAREPECALSGLLLLLGGWEECHRTAQDIVSAEGSYWHAIAHRMEPDFGNSGYWFRRVGRHPIFPELQKNAAEMARGTPGTHWKVERQWDPSALLQLCERAVQNKADCDRPLAIAIQAVEWQLLFSWCADPVRL